MEEMNDCVDRLAKHFEQINMEKHMVKLLTNGRTLQEVADFYGKTKARVQQIAKANGLSRKDIGAAVRKAKAAKE